MERNGVLSPVARLDVGKVKKLVDIGLEVLEPPRACGPWRSVVGGLRVYREVNACIAIAMGIGNAGLISSHHKQTNGERKHACCKECSRPYVGSYVHQGFERTLAVRTT